MNNETIEHKTYRILADLHKNTGAIQTLEDSLKDSIFLTVRDALELAIAEEREASGWISVKDRLPICEFEHEELGVMVSQTVNIYGVSVDDNHGQGFGELHGDGRWVCYGGEHDFMNVKEVTHWSPLPAAPKAEAPR